MGTTYSYWNQDKRQYFSCGLWGEASKKWGIGCGSAARALGLLLRYDWSGDRIAVMGDDQPMDWTREAIDVSVDVMVMLVDVEGPESLDLVGFNFTAVCELATHLRHARIIATLDEQFGPSVWRRRFANQSHGSSMLAQEIYEAQRRGIIRFLAGESR